MSQLFQPLQLRSVTLKNRIAVSPMCQYSSVDGFANDWHLVHLGSRAVGGAGLIIAEATAVSPQGRITPHDLGIWKDAQITMLRRITDFIHSQGSVAGIQLAHAGRKASHHRPWDGGAPIREDEEVEIRAGDGSTGTAEGSWTTEAPSAIAYKDGEPLPHELTKEEIRETVEDFRRAAIRAREAGFRVVELHAAHGYLQHEFLSPLSNQRTDEYGGSFENRIRFVVESVDAIRSVWEESLPLIVRISATDWAEGGWTVEESIELSRLLKDHGVDLIDCSSGGNASGQKITVGPMYQVPFAERIRKEAGIATRAVGLITTASECESIIAEGKADLVLLARELLRDPYFPLHAAKELGVDLGWPDPYARAKRS